MSEQSDIEREIEAAAQHAAEERLAACQEALFAEEMGDAVAPSPAVGPYCGCDTCMVREILDAAWPHMLELARLQVLEKARP